MTLTEQYRTVHYWHFSEYQSVTEYSAVQDRRVGFSTISTSIYSNCAMQPPLFCAVTRLFSIPCIGGPASHYGTVFYSTALYHTVFSEISVYLITLLYQATRQLEQTEVLFCVLYQSD